MYFCVVLSVYFEKGYKWCTVSKIFTIHQLKSFTLYTFRVYAINELGSSPKSKTLTIKTFESGKFNNDFKNKNDNQIHINLIYISIY